MRKDQGQQLIIDVLWVPKDDSYYIAIVKDGVRYRLAAYYLTKDAAMTDLTFLLSKLERYGFAQKGG